MSNDEKLEQRAKQTFDESVDSLDAATLSKLNQGRQRALQEAARGDRVWVRWMPAVGAAAAVVLAIGVVRGPGDMEIVSAPAPTDLDIILSEESIEMIEDLEFYSWLDTVDMESDGDFG